MLHLAAALLQVRCSALSITTSPKAVVGVAPRASRPPNHPISGLLARLSAHPLGHLRFFKTQHLDPLPPCRIGASVPGKLPLTALTPRRPLTRPFLATRSTIWKKRLDHSLPVSRTLGLLTASTKTDPWFHQNSPTAWRPLFRGGSEAAPMV